MLGNRVWATFTFLPQQSNKERVKCICDFFMAGDSAVTLSLGQQEGHLPLPTRILFFNTNERQKSRKPGNP